jgi:ubiquinone/menaquinone biosynthesis C-methylase UbiE
MSLPFAQVSFAEMYERELARPLFQPFAEAALDAVKPAPGERVLDVACGTGIVARLARQRVGADGVVVGVDVNPGMLAVARSVAPDVEWREGNALELPVRSGEQFDVVLCHQGLQFFPDKRVAVGHMRRALLPGGRLAVATWCSDDTTPFGRELRTVAEHHVGPIADRRHGFGDEQGVASLLRDAGFQNVRTQRVTRTVRFREGAVFVRLNAMALVGMSAAPKEMSEGERERLTSAILKDSEPVLRRYSNAEGLAFEIASTLAVATT